MGVPRMPTVAILGGGVAGLSAAHELMERGFTVSVYERRKRRWGGKARSVDKPNSATGDRKDLPGDIYLSAQMSADAQGKAVNK